MKKMVDRYALLEVIGAGQYGKVYRSETTDTNDVFALKVIPIEKFRKISKLSEFTQNEIKVLSMIDHPNIVKYYDKLTTANNVYMIYEYCNGGTLESEIYKNKRLNEKQAICFLGQILDAFDCLRKLNVMHRDLKPSNILMHNGNIKLGDFGFCKPLDFKLQMSKTMVGSPIYMSPELLKGLAYDFSSDIWSIGVVFYEMLFGRCPFEEKTIPKLIKLIEETSLQFGNGIEISEETKIFLRSSLEKNTNKRWSFEDCYKYYNNNLRPMLIENDNKFRDDITQLESQIETTEKMNFSKKNRSHKDIGNRTKSPLKQIFDTSINKNRSKSPLNNNNNQTINRSKSPVKKIFDDGNNSTLSNRKAIARKASVSPAKNITPKNINNTNTTNRTFTNISETINNNTVIRKLPSDEISDNIPSYISNIISRYSNNKNFQNIGTLFNKLSTKNKLNNSILEILEDRIKCSLLLKILSITNSYYKYSKSNYYIFLFMIMKKVRNSYLDIKIKLGSLSNKINSEFIDNIDNFKQILIKENETFNEIFLNVIEMIEDYIKEGEDIDYTLKLILQKPFEFDPYYYKIAIKDILTKIELEKDNTYQTLFLKSQLLDLLLIDEYTIYFFKLTDNTLDNRYFDIIKEFKSDELEEYNSERLNFIKSNYLI